MLHTHIRNVLSCTGLVILLAACATMTPYKPAGEEGYGYQSQQLTSARYRVTFAGNSLTDKDTVRNYLLYRAAELTLANDGDYFIIAKRDIDSEVDQLTTTTGFGFGFDFPFAFGTAVTQRQTSYQAYAIITTHSGTKPVDNPKAYNAHEVVQHLNPVIKRPQSQ